MSSLSFSHVLFQVVFFGDNMVLGHTRDGFTNDTIAKTKTPPTIFDLCPTKLNHLKSFHFLLAS
jgi:hypothetical protein